MPVIDPPSLFFNTLTPPNIGVVFDSRIAPVLYCWGAPANSKIQRIVDACMNGELTNRQEIIDCVEALRALGKKFPDPVLDTICIYLESGLNMLPTSQEIPNMALVREDIHGLFLIADGCVARPTPNSAYPHAEPFTSVYQVGEKPRATHISTPSIIRVRSTTGPIEFWYAHGPSTTTSIKLTVSDSETLYWDPPKNEAILKYQHSTQ